MKKLLSLLLAVIIVIFNVTSVSAASYYESESNDSYIEADIVTLGDSISGCMNSSNDVDYYKMIAPSNGRFSLSFCHTYSEGNNWKYWNVNVYQYIDGQYNELSYKKIYSTDNEKIDLPYVGAVENSEYYIKISANVNFSDIVGENYTLETSFTESNYYEKEKNDSYSTATVINLGKSYSGNISSSNDNDFYKITAPTNGKISLSFCHTYSEGNNWKYWNVNVYQYIDGQYNELSYKKIYSTDNEKIDLPYVGAVENSEYYIKISANVNFSDIVGESYTLQTVFTESNYYEKEKNDSYSTATDINLGISYSGNINSSNDSDYFKYVASSSGKIVLTFNHNVSEGNNWKYWNVNVYQYIDGQYNELSYKKIHSEDNGKIDLPYVGVVENGVYYIKISANVNFSDIVGENYSVKLTKYIAPTSVTSITNSSSGLTIKWNKVAEASGYYVYRKVGSGSFSKLATVTGATIVSYTDKTTKAGTKYSYYVKAYSGSDYSALSNIVTSIRLITPKLKTITNTTSGVKVTWGAVSGADSYAVYRKTKGGSWKKLGSAKSTSYTDKTAKSGTTYYYTVRAENEAGLSTYNSTGLSIKRLANPKLSKKENTTSGVKITWGKVTGARGYIVYRKTSSGSWKEIGKTTKTYYTDKKVKSGTTYYYTVRAYSGSVKSYYDSTGLKIKHLADPTLKTPTSTKSGVSLKWTKTTGAQGYIIYRKTGSGSYKKLKTEKGVSNLSYVDKSAKKGKKYTYKVKAYYSKTYSAYSNTKTIKDKY